MVTAVMLINNPPWLQSLLSSKFFTICSSHKDSPRTYECNMFCLDCNIRPFCFYCKSTKHINHQVLQIRRSSYHDVVKVAEIQNVLDISGVQTYVINNARVLFLNERPQHKGSYHGKGGSSHVCETCYRTLLDPLRFCSLGCKLVEIKKNGEESFILNAKNNHEAKGGIGREGESAMSESKGEEELLEARAEQNYQTMLPSNYSNSRRKRKGVPQRAPLGP